MNAPFNSMKTIPALLLIAVHGSGLASDRCAPVTPSEILELETFVKHWYSLPSDQKIRITDSNAVDSACYRKLIFRASVPSPMLILYLTPDGKHLVSGIMDLTVDPSVAQRKRQEEVEHLLLAGALLTSASSDGLVRMVVFSDFQCPYCKRFANLVNELTREERATLDITYRQLPLNIHAWAQDAAALSVCVALQDKAAFWKLYDFFFAEQQELSKESVTAKALESLTQERSVDRKKVESCLAEKGYQESLQRDEQLAMDLGITATPTVFLNGRRLSIRSVEDLRAAIKSAEAEDGRIAAAQR